MKKELINIGQSLNLATGELSTLNEHKNTFSGHMLIHGSVKTGKHKLIKHLIFQFIKKEPIDIYFIDFKGSQNQEYITDIIKEAEQHNFNIKYFSTTQTNIDLLTKYNYDLNNLKLYEDNNNLYLFQTFPIINRSEAEDFYLNILNHLIFKATNIIETSIVKDVLVVIPYFNIFPSKKLITLFNKAGGLGFKFILSTDYEGYNGTIENDSIEDNVNTKIFFKCRNISDKEELTLLQEHPELNFMKLKNLQKRHFLFKSNDKLYYCLSPFMK